MVSIAGMGHQALALAKADEGQGNQEMTSRISHDRTFQFWTSMALGALAFAAMTGGRILSPVYIDWLMEGDPATYLLGWQFFRHTPLLQWPIGANLRYGMELGSSVVFTDSLPLLAFVFKPVSGLLPDTFQYIGLWIAICFLLQSFFAHRLLALFTHDRWLPLIGSAFFLIAPVWLYRLDGHYVLFGQWLLL